MSDETSDVRIARADAIWQALKKRTDRIIPFGQFLQLIPPIPSTLDAVAERLPHLVLVDPRFTVTDACKLAEIYFASGNESLHHTAPRSDERQQPFWTRMSTDSERSQDLQEARLCKDEAHATAVEGAFFLLEHPGILQCKIKKHDNMLLVGGSCWPHQPHKPAYYKYWDYAPPDPKHALVPNAPNAEGELALHQSDGRLKTKGVPKLIRHRRPDP